MDFISAALFGILQGLTEFLPVSSSGHLALFENFFSYSPEKNFLFRVVAVHAGTLLSVAVVFRRDIWELFTSNRKCLLNLFVGSIPAGIFGLLCKNYIEKNGTNLLIVGVGLLISAVFLLSGKRFSRTDANVSKKKLNEMSLMDALVVGFAQALAIIPGISRSGSTISMSQFRGVENSSAARFAFLLMIPAVGGATLLDVKEVLSSNANINLIAIGISFVVAFITGTLALKLLLNLLDRGRFHYFAYYLIPLGLATILYRVFA